LKSAEKTFSLISFFLSKALKTEFSLGKRIFIVMEGFAQLLRKIFSF
jgi:hypothetical protein